MKSVGRPGFTVTAPFPQGFARTDNGMVVGVVGEAFESEARIEYSIV